MIRSGGDERPEVLARADDGVADVLGDDAVVAEDDVVVLAGELARAAGEVAVEQVVAGRQVVALRLDARVDPRDRELAGDHVDVDAVVAVDLVGAAHAADLVVARAAGEVVARGAADDQVVAGAAVGDEADRRQGARGTRVEEQVRVDDVVALEAVRARLREEEVRRAVADLGRERLECRSRRSTA